MAEDLLISRDLYLKYGAHIGTKFKTKYLEKFIFKTREDGLSVFNISEVDKRLRTAFKFLSRYAPEDILVVGRRETALKPLMKLQEITGIKTMPGRYFPGMLTNPSLKEYTEAKILLAVDPVFDKNAIDDAFSRGIPIVAICDTNNTANKIDLVIPFNNKGRTSLGLFFWLFAKYYMLNRGMIKNEKEFKYEIEDFMQQL
ncbi:MAG: 30S ribosomal protein S2 [Candidatus Woesearchaeota archaeon]